ncbi:hypothetical protein [Nitrosomonas halophila]|uniref:Uncharacterized protein n=1 Tax=Nitrosomonas halophila TaxID=44576 RepID=A0A1H3H389_9PROT|nr:hypothetical protein [Nitrosomonas halophila]SDY09800.1 hypothetical protein SAMN05421881_10186 [Nitrosomonas halophila]
MKSTNLKPKILSELLDLFDHDPSPGARLTVDSIKDRIKGASEGEIENMLKHLHHVGCIEYAKHSGVSCAAINDKGIGWLNTHEEYLKQQSIKNWLIKPAVVALVVSAITALTTITVSGNLNKQEERSALCLEHFQQNTGTLGEK